MDEMNWTLPSELENALAEFYTGPKPDQDFASRLEMELQQRFDDVRVPETSPGKRLSGKNPMRFIRLRLSYAILLAILALLLFGGAVYAFGRLTGFIPGFGFTSGAVYVMDAPVEQSQNGVVVKIKNAVNDDANFWVELNMKGTLGDYPQVYIISQGGEKIQAGYGSSISSEPGVWHMTYTFPVLNDPDQPITLLLENFGSQTFQMNFSLRPARDDEVVPILSGSGLPVYGKARDGLALQLDSIAMTPDRTILQVSLHFDDPNVSLAESWGITMQDSEDHIYPLTDITPETIDRSTIRIYQTMSLHGKENLILNLVSFPPDGKLTMLMDSSANPATFTFDLGNDPQVGQVWSLDRILQVKQFTMHLVNARLKSPRELIFEFEPSQNLTGVMMYSPFASGASGDVPTQDGNLATGMTFAQIPDGSFELQIRGIYYTITGSWQVTWQAPAATVLDFPTMIYASSPTPPVIPTAASQDPLMLEVQALVQKFDQSIIQGPAWIHVVYENTAKNLPVGQTYPPPYYQDEEWYEIDANGWVLRNLSTHRDSSGNILQQSASIGTKGVNFTTGDSFENSPYRLSLDFLSRDLDSALQRGQSVLREETNCDDGSPCLLVTVLERFSQPIQNPDAPAAFYGHGLRVWINLESGLQVKHQSFWQLQDGEEQVDFTQHVLLVENVITPPKDVLDILARIVGP